MSPIYWTPFEAPTARTVPYQLVNEETGDVIGPFPSICDAVAYRLCHNLPPIWYALPKGSSDVRSEKR